MEECFFRPSDYISIGTAIIALVAVIISPIISFKITKKQLKNSLDIAHKQIIAPMRQKWINELRIKIVEYVTELRTINFDLEEQSSISDKEVDAFFIKITSIKIKIELMLNPEEEEHNKLIILMSESCKRNETQKIEINWSKLKDLVDYTKKVLKIEWNVVKEGK